MSGGRASRRSVLLALAAGGVGLGGCGGLPGSGDVVSGARLADDPRIGLLQVIPTGPVRGASPEEIVRGFLLAAGAGQDEHPVARRFLTPRAVDTWRPDAGAVLVLGQPAIAALDASASPADADSWVVQVSAEQQAALDADGHYAARAPGTGWSAQVLLRRERDEWRIDEVFDGVLLTEIDASRTLRSFPVWFGAQDLSQLVADLRWFSYGSDTATRLVTELLDGATSWFAPAVATGAPPGTRLRLGTVPVTGGTATVELTDEALQASPEQRGLLLSQLRATLSTLPGVSQVAVTVGGTDLTRASSDELDIPRSRAATDARLVLLGPSGLSRWDRTAVRAVTGVTLGTAAEGSTHPAVSPQGGPFAVLAGGDTLLRLQRPGGPVSTVLRSSAPLTPPSMDRLGWVWTVQRTSRVTPLVVPADAATAAENVALDEDFDGSVLRFAVARDGARAAVVTRTPSGRPGVRAYGVDRDAAGRPRRLTGPSDELLPGAAEVVDLAWLLDDSVVLLARDEPGKDLAPVVVPLGGAPRWLPAAPGAVSVAAGWSERDIVIGTAEGTLLTRSGASWVVAAEGTDPAYPG
ncbi:LpqB family beta-propeller domain-containing protein [Kineococcus gynurae]|uniref:LpqB family beta-propeller domain-containing protein n=1 Tax=Kineococcus gynurae TaxID=452979 RepID=A0ABV5LRA2_9ACTN